jgi:hypothetical protein
MTYLWTPTVATQGRSLLLIAMRAMQQGSSGNAKITIKIYENLT